MYVALGFLVTYNLYSVCVYVYTCMCVCVYIHVHTCAYVCVYVYVHTYILLTSKPIHELRLDLNVANTVTALTIRVIYLSLIITLKRGVVVLWFTVTVHYHLRSLS